jgi:uncharacterized protein
MGMQRPSEGAMQIPHDALLLRIFTSVDDRFGLEPLHLAIVDRAHAMNMAGATVLRGSLGFGSSRRMHEPRLSPFRVDTPVVVEIVDSEEKIEAFLPVLDEMMESGLVTLSIGVETGPTIGVQKGPTRGARHGRRRHAAAAGKRRRPPRLSPAAAGRTGPAQVRVFSRQLALPVSRMSQWCVSRSSRAVVIFASPNTLGHSANGRLVVTITEVRS